MFPLSYLDDVAEEPSLGISEYSDINTLLIGHYRATSALLTSRTSWLYTDYTIAISDAFVLFCLAGERDILSHLSPSSEQTNILKH